jgi:hypothetical protein
VLRAHCCCSRCRLRRCRAQQQTETAQLAAGRVLHSAYDVTGRRLATASEGQELRVFLQSDDGGWTCTASWKARGAQR